MNTLLSYAWSLYRQVLDLFVPPACVVCKRVGIWLCEPCAQHIPLFDTPICPSCGRSAPTPRLCPTCRATPPQVAPIRAAYLFGGAIRDVIHALKYRGASDILAPLGGRLAESWRYHQLQSDVLVPVPLHTSRETKRGYNQAAVIARAVGRQIDIPVIEGILVRIRNTASQTYLNREQRKQNIDAAAFACMTCEPFQNKRITLVDDVATTGATLEACATVMLACGARSINAFTLARAA